jgi:hypothetical protein
MTNWMQHRQYAEDVTSASNPFHRGNCPFCGGRGTFTASRDTGTIRYNCYKLGCSVGGEFITDMSAREVMMKLRPAQKEERREPDTMVIPEYVVDPLPEHDLYHKFVAHWGIQGCRLLYDIKDRRAVFPIYYKGRMIDATGRALDGAIPKWYRYTGVADYYTLGDNDTALLIVEDTLSAIIAHQTIPTLTTMAILGTNLSSYALQKCAEYDKVIIALDPDASSKTIEFKRQVESWTGLPTYAMRLHDDIKYRVAEDIEHLERIANA